jgi:molecular chaperone GrpE
MTRHTPDEGAVRDQMRERDNGAAAPDAAAPAAPEPEAPEQEQQQTEEAQQPAAESQPEAEAQPEPAEEEPQDPLAKAQAERDQYLDVAQRTQAEFENYRKRTAQQAAQAGERAKVGLLREVLPVVDNLERALAAAADSEGPLHEGVKLVLADLQGVLARAGVEPLEPVGERFDPNVHEALSTRPEEGAEAGVVVEVVEKGYRTADSVIRPARVVVSA